MANFKLIGKKTEKFTKSLAEESFEGTEQLTDSLKNAGKLSKKMKV